MNRKYRITAILLIICLCVSVLPERAHAQEPEAVSLDDVKEPEDGNIPEDDIITEDIQQEQPDVWQADDTDPAKTPEEKEAEPKDTQLTDKQSLDAQWEAGQPEEEKTEDIQPDEELDADDDDPGKGRLQGNAPAEFYGTDGTMRAMATGIRHNSKFAGYDVIDGIDVSKWNKNINWTSVKKSGIDFAFIRTSYRGYEKGGLATDSYGASNMKNAAAAGVKVGAYIFSQAITVKEAQDEADYLLKSVKGYNITMPLVFDFEYYPGGRLDKAKLSKQVKTNICLAFCERIKAAGYTPMVYANKSMLADDLYASEISSKYPVWLANYTTETKYAGAYSFWQYTENGSVSGITGKVDMNVWYTKPGESMFFGEPGASSSTAATELPATTLSGKASSYDKVNLTWKKTAGATGYAIYRYNASTGSYEKIKTINSAASTAYTDTGRTMGTAYKYRVKVFKKTEDGTVYSKSSNTVTVKTDPTMTGKTNGTSVAVRKGPSTSKGKLKTLKINTGVTITGTSGSWYRISLKIGGKKKTGYVKKSDITIIRKPTLSVSAMSTGKVKLTWDKISGASGYEIQRYNSSKKKYVTIKTIKKGTTASYTNSGLKKKTTYKYRIRSYKTVRGRKIYSYYCSAKSVKTR